MQNNDLIKRIRVLEELVCEVIETMELVTDALEVLSNERKTKNEKG